MLSGAWFLNKCSSWWKIAFAFGPELKAFERLEQIEISKVVPERNRLVGILINGQKWYSIPHICWGPDYNHLIRKYFSLWNSHSYQIPNWLILKTMRDKRFSKSLIAQIFLVNTDCWDNLEIPRSLALSLPVSIKE